jgi:hypothetical protein
MDGSEKELKFMREFIERIPKPNRKELPKLYEDLDRMSLSIARVIIESKIYDMERHTVHFEKANTNIIQDMIERNYEVMVPFFVMICGFSEREMKRLYGINDVYALVRNKNKNEQDLLIFADVINNNLHGEFSIETLIYKFYKNWEEHQKRHIRGRSAEQYILDRLRSRGFQVGKVRNIKCSDGRDSNVEVDIALPPNPESIEVAMEVRTGVRMDLMKRAKEFSEEFDKLLGCGLHLKFIPVYIISSSSEYNNISGFRNVLESERKGKQQYDLLVVEVSADRAAEIIIKKLEEWGYHGGSTP